MPLTYIHPPVKTAACSTSCLTLRILSRTVAFLQWELCLLMSWWSNKPCLWQKKGCLIMAHSWIQWVNHNQGAGFDKVLPQILFQNSLFSCGMDTWKSGSVGEKLTNLWKKNQSCIICGISVGLYPQNPRSLFKLQTDYKNQLAGLSPYYPHPCTNQMKLLL